MAEVKKLSMKDAIKQINKACKDWDILGSGNFSQNLKKLDINSLGVSLPLKGGLPYGQLITAAGIEGAGKSTFAILTMAAYQKENPNKVCVYVDAENTLLTQADYFKTISDIDYSPEHFVRYDCTGRSAEEVFQDLILLQSTDDIGMIVIDSARALISQADLDGEFVKDNGQRASVAKPLGKFIKQMIMYLPKRNNILLILNQVNVEKTMFSTVYTEPAGYGLKYFPSLKLRFGTRTYTKGDKTDITSSKVDEEVDGIRLHFAITKSRLSNINKEGGFVTIRYNKGIDTVFDLIEVAIKAGFIQRPNTKTYILVNLNNGEVYKDSETGNELSFGSKDALSDYLNKHSAFVKDYSNMIMQYLNKTKTKVDLIDENIINDLMKQEADTLGVEDTTAEQLAEEEATGE